LKKTIGYIEFSKTNTLKQELKSFTRLTILISFITGCTIFIFLIVFRQLVILPISKISQTLDTDSIKPIESLLESSGEFKKLAGLMIDFFNQKDTLKEINAELLQLNNEIQTQNEALNQQKEEIQAQAENLEQANIEMTMQKMKIEKSHFEVTSNINYAHRIQNALLPQPEELKQFFPKHFVFYQPRNIVSGDFYWVKKINNTIVFITADCTGHGVSGAFMSLLGITFLNEIITKLIQLKRKAISANEILNMLREQIMKVLHQTGKSGTTSDGMDAAVCIFDLETQIMQYSGANMPAIVIQNNELIELKSDKMPIGIHPRAMNVFANHAIKLEETAIIYTFSDGFGDQFGGENDKKYLRQNFKKFLFEIHKLSLDNQLELIKKEFNEWKRDKNQTDDVMVLGIQAVFNKNLILNEIKYYWESYRILIAEDSEFNFRILETYLSSTNVSILWAKNGLEAINLLKKDPSVNLILMDLQMPEMNGYEAIKEIRTFDKTIPIIVQTAYNVYDEKERSFQAGCNDYILKPYSVNEILTTVSKYLN
jgi:CheY-like chemotaxis protein/serine phosphatase RsbU (regulator of sigma subunit)